MKYLKTFFLKTVLMSVATLVFSCSNKDDTPIPTPVEKIVYVAGSQRIAGKDVATLWKNNVPTKLTDGTKNSNAIRVKNSGQDIYILIQDGTEYKILKNGASLYTLVDCTKASGLFVVGNDVYVSGKYLNFAKYWKNNTQANVSQGVFEGDGVDLVVINDIVVVVGTEGRTPTITVAMQWSPGLPEGEMSDPNGKANVFSICPSGNNYYISGVENLKGKIWKNGKTAFTTPENGYLGGISSNENGLFSYGKGYFGTTTAIKLYKDNNFSDLPNNFEPNSIFLSGTDVYMTGSIAVQTNIQNAVYKNGVLTNYGTVDDLSTIKSIFVQ